MGDKTSIQWTSATWNPLRGCSRVSEGCRNCYAERVAGRFSGEGQAFERVAHTVATKGGRSSEGRWNGRVELVEHLLNLPLRWKAPRRVFVNSMSDLFHEKVEDAWIDRIFAVMALAPQHTFQVLTKRPKRMRAYLADPSTPGRVAKAIDRMAVAREIEAMGEPQIEPIAEFPGYLVSDHGDVFSQEGSPMCIRCGNLMPDGIARRLYCGKKCKQLDAYYRKTGRQAERPEGAFRLMKPMPGKDGHQRVMLYRDGKTYRELVHRLVLSAFVRPGASGEQGCHRDGDPTNNALPNLRWSDQEGNWLDRKRHGNARSWSKLTDDQVEEIRHRIACGHPAERIGRDFGVSGTQIRNISRGDQWARSGELMWPLPQVHCGVSVEDQATADERIPLLLQTPAAVRWVSYEPALGPVRFGCWLHGQAIPSPGQRGVLGRHLDWIVIGGESGPGSRPFDLGWARAVLDECRVYRHPPVFVKQLGARPYQMVDKIGNLSGEPFQEGIGLRLRDRKGGDWSEWPPPLKVREYPA